MRLTTREFWRFIAATGSLTALSLTGCGFGGQPISTSPVAGTSNNWELTTKATTQNGSSAAPLTDLSGSILESNGAAPHRATVVFQATAGCYAEAEVVPFEGSINGTAFTVRSFPVRGQFMDLAATFDSTAAHMTGTYTIGGGCGNGESGTLAGTRYSSASGTFAGATATGGTGASGSHTVSLVLTQNSDPTGEGTFLLSGTATIGGFACFTSATVPAGGGNVSGSKVSLVLNADGASGAVINLSGNIDPAATVLTVPSLVITGSNCAGNYGPVTLQRQ